MQRTAKSLLDVKSSLTALSTQIANGEVSAVDALERTIANAEEANRATNAIAVWRIDGAQRDAEKADAALKSGKLLGKLHGVPLTIKECFDLEGTPSTMGLCNRAKMFATEDGEMVRRLRRAGAVIFAKTNVPQLMISHETTNPLYGLTMNPWDKDRTPGGSSGGEAALIAAGGSLGGMGSDLGGSIRVPCHFCGIAGLKPTSGRLPRHGGIGSMRGLDALMFQPGPMARDASDCGRILEVMCDPYGSLPSPQAPPMPLADWEKIDVRGMRIGFFEQDAVFEPAPAICRAVREACERLREKGASTIEFPPLENERAFDLFAQALTADGGADHSQFIHGNPREPQVSRLVRLMATPLWIRRLFSVGLAIWGDRSLSRLIKSGGGISTAKYWKLTRDIQSLAQETMTRFRKMQLSALVFPVYGLPAIRHGDATNALPAASCSIFTSVLGTPCGATPVTRVQTDEQRSALRKGSHDSAIRAAIRAEMDSVGLPIGVQVTADYWREDVVLAVMKAIEAGDSE
jgi:fatty acid amide hydrolase